MRPNGEGNIFGILAIFGIALTGVACNRSESLESIFTRAEGHFQNPSVPESVSAVPSVSPSQKVQVFTYNLGLSKMPLTSTDVVPCNEQRRNALLQAIREEMAKGPTIFLIQELWQEADAKKFRKMIEKKGYSMTSQDVAGRGLAILTTGQIVSEDFYEFSTDDIGRRRGILSAEIDVAGTRVHAYSTHTSFSDGAGPNSKQIRQFKQITRYMSQIPFEQALFGGDFNAGKDLHYRQETYSEQERIWSPFIATLSPDWYEAEIDEATWDDENNKMVTQTSGLMRRLYSNLGGRWPELTAQLDHIFIKGYPISGAARAFDQTYPIPEGCDSHREKDGGIYLSDHYGVKVEIDLAQSF